MARILRLLLVNRKRLSGIKKIDIDFSHEKHLLLGDNGSGKTNLLTELSALPPDNKDYDGPGQKSIWFELDDGKIITFNSYPNQKRHHEVFINDDETDNINLSGTVTEQKELAKKYTGITKEFFDLLILGLDRFTETKPVYRREVFNKINTTNFDYALKIYQKARDGFRNDQAIIKHLTKQLVLLESQKLEDSVIQEMGSRQRLINDELAIWLDLKRKDLVRKPNEIKTELEKLAATHTATTNRLLKRFDKIESDLDSPEKVKEKIAHLNGEIKIVREVIAKADKELNEKRKTLQFDSKNRQLIIEEIKRIETFLENNKKYDDATHLPYLSQIKNLGDIDELNKRIDEISLSLNHVPEDGLTAFTKDYLASLMHTNQSLNNSLRDINTLIDELSKTINHFKEHADKDKVECPNCHFHFVPLLNITNIDSVNDAYQNAIEQKEKLLLEISDLENKILEAETKLEQKLNLLNQIKGNTLITNWWLHCGLSIDKPQYAFKELFKLRTALKLEIERRDYYSELNRLNEKLAMCDILDHDKEMTLKNELAQLELDLDKSHFKLHELTKETILYRDYLNELNAVIKDISSLSDALDKIETLRIELDCVLANQFVDMHIADLTLKSAELVKSLDAALNNVKNRVSIKKEIEEKEKNKERHTDLIRALSPVDGIIAEGMTGFINRFIDDMNTVIKKSWEDHLVIRHCMVDNTNIELDYTFVVETLYELVPDVSLCSKGQREIIDWAFREVAMCYLGLHTHPVLFDEWSGNMDEAHQLRACELLGNLTYTTNHSQLIVASHFKVVHEALGDVRRLVLSSKNMSLHGTYNEHAIIER